MSFPGVLQTQRKQEAGQEWKRSAEERRIETEMQVQLVIHHFS